VSSAVPLQKMEPVIVWISDQPSLIYYFLYFSAFFISLKMYNEILPKAQYVKYPYPEI
jgi:hypothetical protein